MHLIAPNNKSNLNLNKHYKPVTTVHSKTKSIAIIMHLSGRLKAIGTQTLGSDHVPVRRLLVSCYRAVIL